MHTLPSHPSKSEPVDVFFDIISSAQFSAKLPLLKGISDEKRDKTPCKPTNDFVTFIFAVFVGPVQSVHSRKGVMNV